MLCGHERISTPDTQVDHATTAYRAWRKLSADKRLAAVERRLSATNFGDGYPLAL